MNSLKPKAVKKSSTMKSLPANFEVINLARDYPEKEMSEIRNRILQEIKANKDKAAKEPKTDYETLLKRNNSQDLEGDIKKQGYAIMALEPVHTGICDSFKRIFINNLNSSQ